MKALARQHACSGAYEHWLMEYAICTRILCTCESNERLRQDCMHTKSRLSIDWKNMPYVRPICACAKQWRLWRDCSMPRRVLALTDGICRMYAHFVHVLEQWRLWQDCMHTKSRLSIVWKNMPYVRPICACARAVKALARLYACSGASDHWLMEYAICTPILCMC